jgi:5-oxoprolinase (ATP-hydrolysing)
VGPESAGANPGPACYGFGGPLTITDANLFTGRIIPAYFPKTFGPDRKSLLITNTVKEKFAVLTETINATTKQRLSPWEIANGFIRIANENMAQAIKEISVSKGFDVRDYTLVCFGGAGGQHACQVASLLGIKRIIFHSFSGVMSAYGIGLSTPSEKRAITVLKTYNRQTHGELSSLFEEIERNRFSLEETDKESMHIKREIDLRPQGADTFLTVEYKSYKETFDTFRDKHKRLYGFWPEKTPLEVVNVRVEVQEQKSLFSHVSLKNDGCDSGTLSLPQGYGGQLSYQNIYYQGEEIKAPVYHREFMIPFEIIKGPAFIIDRYATVVVEPHFEAYVDKVGTVTVTQVSEERQPADLMTCKPDPVLLEVFYNLFMGVATEMGYTLKNTAHSVNIKERLDFSCAIFDHDGNLVANAPHIPVHIGAMADTVKAIIKEQQGNIQPGDVFLTNDPYRGGSHLPDLTVVHPVFSDQGEVLFFTAARGHHADIGGITPGSMPPATTHIDEEGVLIRDFLLVRDEKFREEALLELFQAQRFPVRNVAERIGDLKAQVASCHKGENELKEIISRYGWNRVCNYMGYIQDNGAFSVKNALSRFLKGKASLKATFADYLDDDTPIKVSIYITGGSHPPDSIRALIDFSGTGDQHNGDNLNAPLSVARSAVLYVLRLLIKSDIPLNSGCLRPIEIKIPEGTILNPAYPAPVASGNVETSQRIVDALLGALALAAASQGTMNNLLFEVEGSPPYYETIAGGSGATDNCPGASGVQVHMTNTRGTDPEILESRFPGVRLEQLTLRRHSGGEGRYRGGDGIVKEIRFLKPAKITIISERRIHAPYGMAGGRPGKRGINYLKGTQGKKSKLPHRVEIDVKADDVIRIETPGGGGYGEKPE